MQNSKCFKSIFMLLFLSMFASLTAQNLSYEQFENDPMHVRIYTLDNGMKVYMSVNKDEPRIQTLIAVKTGSKNDPDNATGLAHYLEHMVFKGTDQIATDNWPAEKEILSRISDLYELHRAAKDEKEKEIIYKQIDSLSFIAAKYANPNEYDKIVSSIGATGTNAYTSMERTVYINNIPSNELEKWAKLESERFSQLVLRLFHTELEAVFEEFNRGQDNDMSRLWDALFTAAFPKHPYGTHTTIGKGFDLKNPSMVKIHEFFDNYYVPNNMALCMAGDFNPDEAIQVINKYFGQLKQKAVVSKKMPKKKKMKKPVVKEIWGQQEPSVVLAWRFPGFNTTDSRTMDLVNEMLNNGKAGMMDIDLIQSQKVLNAWAYAYRLHDYSLFILSGSPREGQSLEEVRDLLIEELNKLKNGGFESWLINASTNDLKYQQMVQLESNNARASMMVNAFILESPWQDYISQIDANGRLTKDDVVTFANKYFTDNFVTMYKRQGENKDKLLLEKPHITPLEVNRDRESDFAKTLYTMQSAELKPEFLDYKTAIRQFPLNSGIEFNYIENTTNDLFGLYYVLDMGSDNDPELALAVNYLPYLGTNKYSAQQLQEEFFKLGLNFDVSTSRDQVYVSLFGLKASLEKGTELLEHMLSNVVPDQTAYQDMVEGILKDRENAKSNKSTILYRGLFSYAQYGENSPFRNIISAENLQKINPQDLVNKIHDLTKYKHEILYYGTELPENVRTLLDRFHRIPTRFLPTPAKAKYQELPINNNKVYFVDYDMVQGEVLQLAQDEKLNITNIPYARLFNNYFGSGLSSIFFQEIREARALAYSAYAAYTTPAEPDLHHYMFSYVGTQNNKLKDAVTAVQELLNNMPQSDQQFNAARESVLKNIASNRITKEEIFWNYLNARKQGINYDIRKDIYSVAQTANMQGMQDFFDKHVAGKQYVYCIIGNKELMDMDFLKSLGDFRELTLEELFNY